MGSEMCIRDRVQVAAAAPLALDRSADLRVGARGAVHVEQDAHEVVIGLEHLVGEQHLVRRFSPGASLSKTSRRRVTTVWLAHWTCSIFRLARAKITPSTATVTGVAASTMSVTIYTLFHESAISRPPDPPS